MKLAILTFFLVSSILYSSNVSGAITNSANGKSIPNANIYIKELEIGSVSNSYGTYKIDVPKGQYLIQITNIGFETFSSLINVEDEDIVLDIAMEPVILKLDEVSVEALFSTRLGYESAKIILKSELKEFDRQSAADMLRMLPGVDAQYAYPDGRNVNLSIRGSSDYKPGGYNNRVLVLLDGFPMLIPNSGSPDWSSVPMESIERIEIDNSPASAQYGHNSMGGVINLITDHNHEKSLTTLSMGGGSFSTGTASFSKKFKSKNWNFGFNGMTKISDGHRNNSEHQLGKIRSFLKFNSAGRTYRLSHIASLSDIGHPGFYHSPSFRKSKRLSNYIQGHGFYPISEGISMSHSIYLNTFQTEYYDSEEAPEEKLEGNRLYDDISVGLRSEMLMTKLQRWIIMLGLDSDWSKSSVTVFNPIYNDPTQVSMGSFLQSKYSIGNGWSLGMGFRYDYRITNPGNNYKIRTYSNYSPKLNIMYKIRDKRAFTISYNEGFRAPSLSELYLQHISSYGLIQQGNPDILPERVKSIEMSYEHPHSDSWIWSISTFYNQYENMIDFVYTLPVRSVNRKGVFGSGLEYQFKFKPNQLIGVQGQYNYLNMKDEEGIPVLYRSKHRGQLSMSFNTKIINCFLLARYWSEQNYEDFLSHEYDLIGDKIIFPIKKLPMQVIPEIVLSRKFNTLDLSVRISNLFNKKYELIQDYPMPGRVLNGKITKSL